VARSSRSPGMTAEEIGGARKGTTLIARPLSRPRPRRRQPVVPPGIHTQDHRSQGRAGQFVLWAGRRLAVRIGLLQAQVMNYLLGAAACVALDEGSAGVRPDGVSIGQSYFRRENFPAALSSLETKNAERHRGHQADSSAVTPNAAKAGGDTELAAATRTCSALPSNSLVRVK